ncbi:peroxisome biogenesis factor 10-like [Agrilus planipennis]|uniref:RING-type E3 ubiquitin transferase n=1 Tax=Agrilus planipennis TaxID=224129 RepID=A0A1W4W9X0_AGRPL|nr:peroxisome biogenesis factor 10-like [Agrilus planipennis]
MNFRAASVVDILRCSQKDNFIIGKLQSSIFEILKILGNEYRHQNTIKNLSSALYFLLTSCSNLQSFGEEYSGIIRFDSRTKTLPSQFTHLLWLVLYITGDNIFNNILHKNKHFITKSKSLTEEAKNALLCCLYFLKTNKHMFVRLHTALFYIKGDYYYISNFLFGIRYILLRQWYQDNNYSQNFKFLGKVLLLYLCFYLVHQIKFSKTSQEQIDHQLKEFKTGKKVVNSCLICSKDRKYVITTFCGHLFCWDCIQSCLLYQEVCPVCRESVNPNKTIMLQNYS